MKLTKLFKAVGVAAIIGACLLPTACQINTTVNKGNSTVNNSGDEDNVPVPQQTQPNSDAANAGLTIDQNTGKIVSNKSSVDFSNYATGTFSIKVRNNTHKRLVAFKNAPSADNLLSGIPSYEQNWGLKFKSNLFQTSQDFILFVVTEEDYVEHLSRLDELEGFPFAKIYAFYNNNTDGMNNNVYDISSHMGGNCTITFDNRLGSNNVELRNGSITGETIGYVAAYTAKTVFKVEAGTYYIYPVFRSYSKTLNEIVTRYPKTPEGYAVVRSFELSDLEPNAEIKTNFWANATVTPSSAYIRINNNLDNGINLYDSNTGEALRATDGTSMINSGRSKVFRVDMDLTGGSATLNPIYAGYKSKATYCIDAGQNRKYITTGTEATAAFEYYAGKMYEVNVDSDGTSYGFNIDLKWKEKSQDVELDK